MNYKIAICDDEPNELEHISSLATKWSIESGHICEIHTFTSAEAFLFAYAEDKTYDILLLDVEMHGISGIDLAREIRRDNDRVEIVFITSHFEFCGEGYEVDALHYLVKPIMAQKLMPVLSKAAEKLSIEPLSLIITCGGGTIRLYETDILYIEALRQYITIYTNKGEYKLKENISAFSDRLSDDFYCTHRSYLVSLKHIVRISRTAVYMDNGIELPLARGKYDDINRAFIEHN